MLTYDDEPPLQRDCQETRSSVRQWPKLHADLLNSLSLMKIQMQWSQKDALHNKIDKHRGVPLPPCVLCVVAMHVRQRNISLTIEAPRPTRFRRSLQLEVLSLAASHRQGLYAEMQVRMRECYWKRR